MESAYFVMEDTLFMTDRMSRARQGVRQLSVFGSKMRQSFECRDIEMMKCSMHSLNIG